MRLFFIIKPPFKKEFQKHFLEFKKSEKVSWFFTEKEGPFNARNLAQKAKKEGFQKIVVIGGDGLINETINGLLKEQKKLFEFSLGIIPAGTGNNFAKEIGIPLNPKIAFSLLKKDKFIEVDIGKVNERFFVNCFSFGFDAEINHLANEIKEKFAFLPKPLSYFVAAAKEIIKRIPEFEISIVGDNIKINEKITLAAITNTQSYGAIFKINPGAEFSDGKLNLCIVKPVKKIKAIYALFLATKGRHSKLPQVRHYLFSKELKISTKESISWEVDGEVLEPRQNFLVKILPKAIRILVP